MKNPNLIELTNSKGYKEQANIKALDSIKSETKESKTDALSQPSLGKGGNDAINMYMKELRAYPLLSREEEIHYGRLSRDGDKESRKKMIVCNLRLVLKIARKYYQSGVDLLDLIEEGNLGLMHAVEKFDPERGFRFSTYATWWIRQNIERAIMNQRHIVRLPIHVQKEYNTFKKKIREQGSEINETTSIDDISKSLSEPVDRVRQVIEWNERSFSTVSKDDDGNVSNIVDFLPDDEVADPSHLLELEDEKSRFDLYQSDLNDRDREILIRRFGIDGSKPLTLGELGKSFGISRERVRQIIQRATQKIRQDLDSASQG